jgi:hypothetical protein
MTAGKATVDSAKYSAMIAANHIIRLNISLYSQGKGINNTAKRIS